VLLAARTAAVPPSTAPDVVSGTLPAAPGARRRGGGPVGPSRAP